MSRFWCEVRGRGAPKSFAGDAKSGMRVVIAGEKGALRIDVRARGDEDIFNIDFEPWRGSESPGGRGVTMAFGTLNFDGLQDKERGAVVRLGDEVLEAFNFCKAKQVMLEGSNVGESG